VDVKASTADPCPASPNWDGFVAPQRLAYMAMRSAAILATSLPRIEFNEIGL
jgi:hypothetical protein